MTYRIVDVFSWAVIFPAVVAFDVAFYGHWAGWFDLLAIINNL